MYNIQDLSMTPRDNPEWFTRALYGGRLIKGGYIDIVQGVKGEERLNQIDLTGKVLQADAGDCGWTPEQILKLSEKLAKVKTFKINLEQCIDALESKRTLYALSPGALNDSLPEDLEAATLYILAAELSNEIEELLVAGNSTTNPDEIDGIYTQLVNSADTIKIEGETITAANAAEAFREVYAAIPEEVLQSEQAGTLYMLCSYATRRVLRLALANNPNEAQVLGPEFTLDKTDPRNPRMYYLGVEIVPVKGLDNATIIAYDKRNIKMLTDLMSDLEYIELGNFPRPNDNKVFIRGRLRLGVAVLFDEEVVLRYAKPATPPNPGS